MPAEASISAGLKELDYGFVQQCMHCGLCLQSCPTYVETGRERNSPRGRIALMRAVADGELPVTGTFRDEMNYCLGCLACVSACPAGVDYNLLFETARAEAEKRVPSSIGRRFVRWLTLRVLFTHPRLLKAVGRLIWLYQASGVQKMVRSTGILRVLPKKFRELEPQAPEFRRQFSDALISEREKAKGASKHRVAVLTGCVQDLAFPEINRATVDVLLENGCDVFTPRSQGCCGSLHAHNGDPDTAEQLARRMIDLIEPSSVDAIISNAAGCGSHLKHFDRLLADDPAYSGKAAVWSSKLRDISEWLVEIGFRTPTSVPSVVTVTYQEACHLCHGQGISEQPRKILQAIPGVVLKECTEATWCCGSAGTYSITQPATSMWLRDRKISHLRATQANVIATANPGCQIQIENGLKADSGILPIVIHPVVLLAEAYRREGSG